MGMAYYRRAILVMALVLPLILTGNTFAFGSGDKSPEEKAAEAVKKATKEYNKGVKNMDKAHKIAVRGDSAFAFNYRATADAKARKEYEKAIKRFNKAIDHNPEMKEAFNNLGYCYRKIDRLKESLEAYEKAIALDPNFAQAREYRGETFLAMGDLANATAEFEFLESINSPYADTLAQSMELFQLRKIGLQLKEARTGTVAH